MYKLQTMQSLDLIIDVGKPPSIIGDGVYRQNALFAGRQDGVYHPIGHVIKNGEWYQRFYRELPWSWFIIPHEGRPHIGNIDRDNPQLYILAFQSTPSLIKDGNIFVNFTEENTASDIWQSRTQRSGIGVMKNGSIILLTSQDKLTLTEFAQLGLKHGLVDMLNLDGGGSVYPTTGWVRPTSSALIVKEGKQMKYFEDFGRMTSDYGPRISPITGKSEFHTGIDLVKEHDGPIYAVVEGEVTHAKDGVKGSGFGGFGNTVAIKDKYNALHCYTHLNHCLVKVGDIVTRGQVIGRQGNTGKSTGSHLHYEVRVKHSPSFGFGTNTDPLKYLEDYFAKEPKPIETKIPKIQLEVDVIVNLSQSKGYLIDDRVYVPLRFVAEKLGAKVAWDDETKTAIVEGGDKI